MPGRGGADIGVPLNDSTTIEIYTTKIERMEQPRTACGAEECRVGPSSAGKGWGRHWGAFK